VAGSDRWKDCRWAGYGRESAVAADQVRAVGALQWERMGSEGLSLGHKASTATLGQNHSPAPGR